MILDLSEKDLSAIILNRSCHSGRELKLVHPDALVFELGSFPDRTTAIEHLSEFLEQCEKTGGRDILAIGGDGTINLVVNALMGMEPDRRKRLTLGMIAAGSSNDSLKPFDRDNRTRVNGLPARLAFESALLVDLGLLDYSTENDLKPKTHYFLNNTSIGLTASGNDLFNKNNMFIAALKGLSLELAIRLTSVYTLMAAKPQKLHCRLDELDLGELTINNLTLLKNPHFTGSLRYPDKPAINDGFFHLYLSENLSLAAIVATFFALGKGRFPVKGGNRQYRTSRLGLHAASPFLIEADGELFRADRAYYTCVKEAIRACP